MVRDCVTRRTVSIVAEERENRNRMLLALASPASRQSHRAPAHLRQRAAQSLKAFTRNGTLAGVNDKMGPAYSSCARLPSLRRCNESILRKNLSKPLKTLSTSLYRKYSCDH